MQKDRRYTHWYAHTHRHTDTHTYAQAHVVQAHAHIRTHAHARTRSHMQDAYYYIEALVIAPFKLLTLDSHNSVCVFQTMISRKPKWGAEINRLFFSLRSYQSQALQQNPFSTRRQRLSTTTERMRQANRQSWSSPLENSSFLLKSSPPASSRRLLLQLRGSKHAI